MELQEKITSTLNDLGNTTDDIAAFLEGQGVKGQKLITNQCVLANYLQNVFNLLVFVNDDGSGHIILPNKSFIIFQLPEPVRHFIHKFDTGWYPNLLDQQPTHR